MRLAILVGGIVLIGATHASAQVAAATTPATLKPSRFFLNLSAGSQTKSISEGASSTFSLYGEDGTTRFTRDIKGGVFPDVMAGIRIRRSLFIAVQASTRNASSDAPTVVVVPDPLAFEAPRTVTGTLTALEHKEQWLSLLPTAVVPVTQRINIAIFAGPSVVNVSHDVVSFSVGSIVEPVPTATFTRTAFKRSVWAFSAGADVSVMLTPQLGVGGFARLQQATVNLPGTGLTFDVGGLQVGGGLRLRF